VASRSVYSTRERSPRSIPRRSSRSPSVPRAPRAPRHRASRTSAPTASRRRRSKPTNGRAARFRPRSSGSGSAPAPLRFPEPSRHRDRRILRNIASPIRVRDSRRVALCERARRVECADVPKHARSLDRRRVGGLQQLRREERERGPKHSRCRRRRGSRRASARRWHRRSLAAAHAVAARGADVGAGELRRLALSVDDTRGIHGDEAGAAGLTTALGAEPAPCRGAALECGGGHPSFSLRLPQTSPSPLLWQSERRRARAQDGRGADEVGSGWYPSGGDGFEPDAAASPPRQSRAAPFSLGRRHDARDLRREARRPGHRGARVPRRQGDATGQAGRRLPLRLHVADRRALAAPREIPRQEPTVLGVSTRLVEGQTR